MQNKKVHIPFIYYADDFTGATDNLAILNKTGAKTILFADVPTKNDVKKLKDVTAIGISTNCRSLSLKKMAEKVKKDFEKINTNFSFSFFHYKVCSTFDSSKNIGSIGKVIDIASEVFKNGFTLVLGGHPTLGRYCAFGNLFATMGIGVNSKVHRLDRHPSMKNHPTTPANESDLALHLQTQTNKKIEQINFLQLNKGVFETITFLQNLIKQKNEIVLFDAISINHIYTIGQILVKYNLSIFEQANTFIVGGSSVAEAIGYGLNKQKFWYKNEIDLQFKKSKSKLILSGSCSPIAKEQINVALQNGFQEIIVSQNCTKLQIAKICTKAIEILKETNQLIIHTGIVTEKKINSEKLGVVYSSIVIAILEKIKLHRLIIAGGDTSSYTANKLGIKGLEFVTPYVAGAPICKVVASAKKINALEVNFKGGQVGDKNYYLNI